MNAETITVREYVFNTLNQQGFRRNSGDYRDYERAKAILLPIAYGETKYRETIKAIVEYLNV